MADITKPDANPIVAALLTAFVLLLGHFLINGQQRKWIYAMILYFIGLVLCIFPAFIVLILTVIDSYQTAERLQKGETIGDNEYTFAPYYKIAKMIDKTATCKNAM